ncbi:MAG: hypothetical protein ACI8W7_004776 [Gammaproteobacteria bacterium]|jgi:hypothetical protein
MRCQSATVSLIEAYRAARYEVDVRGKVLVIGLGQPLPAALDAYLLAHDIAIAAFLSAANPRSMALPDQQNSRRHTALLAALSTLGLSWLDANGCDATGQWPSEPSVLALGIERQQAMHIAEQFEQNAYLEVIRGGSACLILTSHWATRDMSCDR